MVRPAVGFAILAGAGIAIACLIIGAGSDTACTAGLASAACVGGWIRATGDLVGLVAATGVMVGGVLAPSFIGQVSRHRQLSALLDLAALPARVVDHEVRLVPGLASPCVAGLAHPRIYCPPELSERLSGPELRAVLLHERHHQLVHAPARFVVLAALTPVLGRVEAGRRWIERRRSTIEIAADDHALAAGASRSELARALLKLGPATLDFGPPGYASASELRLRHLLGEATQPRSGPDSFVPLVLLAGALVACLAWALMT